jgi:hypothetical protein
LDLTPGANVPGALLTFLDPNADQRRVDFAPSSLLKDRPTPCSYEPLRNSDIAAFDRSRRQSFRELARQGMESTVTFSAAQVKAHELRALDCLQSHLVHSVGMLKGSQESLFSRPSRPSRGGAASYRRTTKFHWRVPMLAGEGDSRWSSKRATQRVRSVAVPRTTWAHL